MPIMGYPGENDTAAPARAHSGRGAAAWMLGMPIEEFSCVENGTEIAADLCIVGSGPAGLTIARELAGTGIDVLVVESGGLEPDPGIDALSRIVSVGAPRILEPTHVRNRIFGGSSHGWSGRCASFDDLDFAARPFVPLSGWPVAPAALAPYVARATRHLGLGPDRPEGRGLAAARLRPRPPLDPALLRHVAWQFSRDPVEPQAFMRFGRRFRACTAANIRILLHASVTHLTTGPCGAAAGTLIESLDVANLEGRRAVIRAPTVVLCAGGIENARLLLCSNRVCPAGVGNVHDLVGRTLMDHPRGSLLHFRLADAAAIRAIYGPYKLDSEQGRHVFADGVALSPAIRARRQLLNCAAWLHEVRAPDDPIDAARRLISRASEAPGRDAWAVASQPLRVLSGLHESLVRRRSVTHKLERSHFLCAVEQRPDPDSRIRLGARRDRLGLPVAEIDWRIGEQEIASLTMLARLIEAEFTRTGLPRPIVADWVDSGRYPAGALMDAAHPSGTTRMAADPRHGVVDENCQVHGVEGLFIAGSSVFPTAGHANPTLMIVALALRLADRLKARAAGQESGRRRSAEPAAGILVG
ncbi:MAG: GMC family oxidoreductase [Rhodospirillales bacterium]|nr:GMC family oxidoreductase [Rhodospirillales bacterium]